MGIAHELSLVRQLHQRIPLKNSVIPLYIVKYFRLQNHEPRIDRGAVIYIFFTKRMDSVVSAYIKHTFLLLQDHRSECRQSPMGFMKGKHIGYIYITDAVSISEHEGLISYVGLYSFDPSAGHGI